MRIKEEGEGEEREGSGGEETKNKDIRSLVSEKLTIQWTDMYIVENIQHLKYN